MYNFGCYRNSRDTHQVDAAFDSFVRQSNDERIVGNSTQRNLDQFNTTTPALYDRRHQHGEVYTRWARKWDHVVWLVTSSLQWSKLRSIRNH